MIIDKWLKRMSELLKYSDTVFNSRCKTVRKYCPYGRGNFCDGRINQTAKNKLPEVKPSCEFFIDGQCSKELHLGKRSKEYD